MIRVVPLWTGQFHLVFDLGQSRASFSRRVSRENQVDGTIIRNTQDGGVSG